MELIAVIGIFALVSFLISVVIRRAYRMTALVVGTVPAALVAMENVAALANPLSWFILLPIWAIGVAGGLIGAWLARMVHARWRRA
ncbi:MAG TPA: hypothetical protein VD887_12020 [Allosphingosinicella sp.]|nr:hypothetical protein [Allosphingosinicella sp.]